MKRLLTAALATVMVAGAFGQGTFTIRRPVDGSKVREVVKVRIPKNSIPEGGYIGVLVNGKFLEAVVPDEEGNDYVYNLDTKARKLADGPMTIETVLYFYTQGAPMVLNRSSVNVVLDNSASIQQSNPNGFTLRYKFVPGKEYTYNRTQRTTVSFVSQAQAQLGSRAAEIVLDTNNVRYLVAVANNYGNEGLIRLQALPERGKDYAYLVTSLNPEPTKFMDFEMHPIFMRITNTGREVFTSLPTYFPLEGTSQDSRTDLFALFPPPILPSRQIEVGDSWEAAIPMPNLDLEAKDTKDDFVENLTGRATLESVEWEQGYPCAKIRSELSLGAADLKNMKGLDGIQGDAQSLKIESIQWFAMDRGIMIREELRFTSEVLVEVGGGQAAGNSGGNNGGAPGLGGFSGAGGGPAGAGSGGGAAVGGDKRIAPGNFVTNEFFDNIGAKTFGELIMQSRPGGQRGGPGSGRDEGGASGFGGVGQAGGGAGATGGTGGVKMILRQTTAATTILER